MFAIAEIAEDPADDGFNSCKNIFLLDKAHFQIELIEFARAAVGAAVLVADLGFTHPHPRIAELAVAVGEGAEGLPVAVGRGDGGSAECPAVVAALVGEHALAPGAAAAWLECPDNVSHVHQMGDAAATGHFSIGSGTRLAFDSAIALAGYLHSEPTLQGAFERYQDERRLEVLRLQSAARNSLEWFEEVERYLHLDPVQFNYSLLTRSQRISHENLRLRDKHWLEGAEAWFQRRAGRPDA